MNGDRKIEIFAPFGQALELTKKILFQPFDIAKWFVIGFAAFLAQLSGGFHSNVPTNFFGREDRWQRLKNDGVDFGGVDQWPAWVIPVIVAGVIFVLVLVALLSWLGARGRFIFTDCIVHNRAAIVAPWKEFRREGNSFFLFSLLVTLVILALVAAALLPIFLPGILRGGDFDLGPASWIGFASAILVVALVALFWLVVSGFMVPVMYRQRCGSMDAFRQVLALIIQRPGPIILFFLFLIVLGVAVAMIGCVMACVTCCIAALPYIGTVILLPLHVCLYGFTLLFLRQFGPDYDVWANVSTTEISVPEIPSPPAGPEPPPLPA